MLQIFESIDRDEWNAGVKRLGGCCFHSYEWSLFSGEANNAKPLYFRISDGFSNVQAMAFGLLSTTNLAGITLRKKLSFGSLPACESADTLHSTIKEILHFSRANRIEFLQVNSFGTPIDTAMLSELGFCVQRRFEFLVDLEGSENDLWNRIHSKKRNLIRKGQKAGLEIVQGISMKQVRQFRQLACETRYRKTLQKISFPGVADQSYYELLKSRLLDSNIGRLYLALYNGKPVAGAFFVEFAGKSYYMLSSANENGLKKAAPDLILWTCMTDYQREGCKMFNLGGVSEIELNGQPLENSGLYHFKKGFSADVYPCYKGELILRPNFFKIYDALKKIKAHSSMLNKRS